MNPANKDQRTEVPADQSELKPRGPKTATAYQGLQSWLSRYSPLNLSQEDSSGRPSKKQKTNESPAKNDSDQSSSKISENLIKTNSPTKEAPIIEIDTDSEQQEIKTDASGQVQKNDAGQPDDNESDTKRTLRDRSKF